MIYTKLNIELIKNLNKIIKYKIKTNIYKININLNLKLFGREWASNLRNLAHLYCVIHKGPIEQSASFLIL